MLGCCLFIHAFLITSYLIVDEAPLLEERVHSHNSTNISSQISAAGGNGQVFNRVEAICIDHEISVVLVHSWSLTSISVVEEFRKSFSFNAVNFMHVEPGTVTGEDDRVRLRDKVLPG